MTAQALSGNFQKSLKPSAIEEFIDYYFYRRLAHLLVPTLIKLGLSPNQVTTVSLLFGLAASYLVLQQRFLAGVALAVIAIVFDCCDGQVARLTGKSSPLGRAIDGTFDLIWITALWLAIYNSGYFAAHGYDEGRVLMLLIASALSMILHCWKFDGVKVLYLLAVEPTYSERDMTAMEAYAFMKEEFKRFNLFTGIIAFCCFFQAYFFTHGSKERAEFNLEPGERARLKARLEPEIRLWPWLGEGHHNTLVLLGLLLAPWTPLGLLAAFWIILVPMNLWWFYCLARWRKTYGEAMRGAA